MIDNVTLVPFRPGLETGVTRTPSYEVSLRNVWFSPLECLALGYVLRYKSITLEKNSLITLVLEYCSISPAGFDLLAKELRRDISYCTPGGISLCLDEYTISGPQALLSLREMLKGQSNIHKLQLQTYFGTGIDKYTILKHVIEGLSCNSSCSSVVLGGSGFDLDPTPIYYLVLLIMSCPQLQSLALMFFNLCKTTLILSRALSCSVVHTLTLFNCEIDDNDLLSLGHGISKSLHLKYISILGNPEITLGGFAHFLSLFVNKESNLETLSIDPKLYNQLMIQRMEVLEQINAMRTQLQRQPLGISSIDLDELIKQLQVVWHLHSLPVPSLKNRANKQ